MANLRSEPVDATLARELMAAFPRAPFGKLARFALFPFRDPHHAWNNDPCWTWDGFRDEEGYGRFNFDGKTLRPYRLSWEWLHARAFPATLVPDHLCRNTACVNPRHIEAVTAQENVLRGKTVTSAHAAKTHCPRGHPYDEQNTYRWAGRRGRQCRTCMNEGSKRWQAARRKARGLRIGSARADAKLNEKQVAEIKRALMQNTKSKPSIATQYGVSPGVIYKIANGETWKHVPWPADDPTVARTKRKV